MKQLAIPALDAFLAYLASVEANGNGEDVRDRHYVLHHNNAIVTMGDLRALGAEIAGLREEVTALRAQSKTRPLAGCTQALAAQREEITTLRERVRASADGMDKLTEERDAALTRLARYAAMFQTTNQTTPYPGRNR